MFRMMVDFFYIKTMSTLSLTSINSISVLSEKAIEYTSIGYNELWEKNIISSMNCSTVELFYN